MQENVQETRMRFDCLRPCDSPGQQSETVDSAHRNKRLVWKPIFGGPVPDLSSGGPSLAEALSVKGAQSEDLF